MKTCYGDKISYDNESVIYAKNALLFDIARVYNKEEQIKYVLDKRQAALLNSIVKGDSTPYPVYTNFLTDNVNLEFFYRIFGRLERDLNGGFYDLMLDLNI